MRELTMKEVQDVNGGIIATSSSPGVIDSGTMLGEAGALIFMGALAIATGGFSLVVVGTIAVTMGGVWGSFAFKN